jgi:hypothetical protein
MMAQATSPVSKLLSQVLNSLVQRGKARYRPPNSAPARAAGVVMGFDKSKIACLKSRTPPTICVSTFLKFFNSVCFVLLSLSLVTRRCWQHLFIHWQLIVT